jgi:hypothetical protein
VLDIASQVELYVAVGTTQIPSVAHFIIFPTNCAYGECGRIWFGGCRRELSSLWSLAKLYDILILGTQRHRQACATLLESRIATWLPIELCLSCATPCPQRHSGPLGAWVFLGWCFTRTPQEIFGPARFPVSILAPSARVLLGGWRRRTAFLVCGHLSCGHAYAPLVSSSSTLGGIIFAFALPPVCFFAGL